MLHLNYFFGLILLYCLFSSNNAYTQGEGPLSPFCHNNCIAERQKAAQIIQPQQYEGLLLVEYLIDSAQNQLCIFTIDKHAGLQSTVVNLPANFDKKIELFQQLLRSFYLATDASRMQFIEQSHVLYKLTIAPIEDKLRNKTNLHIISKGILKNLPFEVLLSTDEYAKYTDLPYLLRRFKVSYAGYSNLLAYADARTRLSVDLDQNPSKDVFILASNENSIAHAQINTATGSLQQQPSELSKRTSADCADLMETGVQNVILSAWLTSEKITNELLAEVYTHLAAHNHKCYASALQEVKLNMLKKPETAVPNQWSGYLLVKH